MSTMTFHYCYLLTSVIFCLLNTLHSLQSTSKLAVEEDVLNPYRGYEGHRDIRRTHRYVRDCQPVINGNLTHESKKPNFTLTKFSIDAIIHDFGSKKEQFGHHVVIKNPLKMISVVEPVGSCRLGKLSTVSETAKAENCDIAINAGFFDNRPNLKTFGECYGNIISDSKMVNDSRGIQNANFGIRQDGTVVVGYLSEEEVKSTVNPFVQLISGVGWILRDGESYLTVSLATECGETEETGPLKKFFDVQAARTIVGYDKNGHVHLVTIDGKTGSRGTNLYNVVSYLQQLGIVNAINLDGGGSTTLVVNGITVNYPGNSKEGGILYERNVSTVLCVRGPKTIQIPEKVESLSYCCNRNYLIVIVLTVVIGFSMLLHVHLYTLYRYHRSHVRHVLSRQPQKEALHSLLNEEDGLSSDFETDDEN